VHSPFSSGVLITMGELASASVASGTGSVEQRMIGQGPAERRAGQKLDSVVRVEIEAVRRRECLVGQWVVVVVVVMLVVVVQGSGRCDDVVERWLRSPKVKVTMLACTQRRERCWGGDLFCSVLGVFRAGL
jgi:hypothetical protein